MNRILFALVFVVGVVACKLPEEKTTPALPALEGQLQFKDLIQRAEAEVTVAIEAFFVDQYNEVELAGQGLKATARFLPRAQDVPASIQPLLALEAEKIGEEAQLVSDAARNKDAKALTPLLGRLHLRIRSLKSPS